MAKPTPTYLTRLPRIKMAAVASEMSMSRWVSQLIERECSRAGIAALIQAEHKEVQS